MSKELRKKIREFIKENYDYYPDFFDPMYNKSIHGFIGRKSEPLFIDESENLDEGALNPMDIPPSVGLIKSEGSRSGFSLNLFDFRTKKCIGHIFLGYFSDRSKVLINIAAESGFGPLMVEFGMMASYPKGVCIDRAGPTKEKVWNMFKIFADKRGDIKKTIIDKKSMEYDNRYFEEGDENKQYLMNVLLQRTPSIWYKKMLERGQRLMEDSDIGEEAVKYICREYFSNRYENG